MWQCPVSYRQKHTHKHSLAEQLAQDKVVGTTIVYISRFTVDKTDTTQRKLSKIVYVSRLILYFLLFLKIYKHFQYLNYTMCN